MHWRFVSVFVAIALSVNFVNHQKKVRDRGQEYAGIIISEMMIQKGINNLLRN